MDARILITILIGIIWLAFRLLRRKPGDTEQQEQPEGDIIFTDAEMNLPWQKIPQDQQIFAEDDEEEDIGQVAGESRIEPREEPTIPQPVSPPTASMAAKRETSQQGITSMPSDTPAYSQQRPKQAKQIIGIPLNTQNVKFGIVLAEILNKPKSQRPH